MTIKTAMTAPLRGGRHCLGAMRSLSPAALIAVTVALLIGGAGFADAATGGNFILGKANSETSTASLTDSKGTPLKLSAPASVAPLAVNGNAMVANLNANYLGGLSASDLQPTGGDGFTNTSISLGPLGTLTVVASTGALPAGTYYVTATAFMQLPGGGDGTCYITTGSKPDTLLATGGGSGPQQEAAETVAVSVTAGDTLQESCATNDSTPGSVSLYAGITAIRILSSSGTTPAMTGARVPRPRPTQQAG